MVCTRECHCPRLSPSRRCLVQVEDIGRRGGRDDRLVRIHRAPGFHYLPRRVHDRAPAINRIGVHYRPGLRADIEHLADDGLFGGRRCQHTPVGNDEHVRVVRETIARARQLSPDVSLRVVDFGDRGEAPVAVDLPGNYEYTTIRERRCRRIPAPDAHRRDLRPAARCRIEKIRVSKAHVSRNMSTRDDNPPVRQLAVA